MSTNMRYLISRTEEIKKLNESGRCAKETIKLSGNCLEISPLSLSYGIIPYWVMIFLYIPFREKFRIILPQKLSFFSYSIPYSIVPQ